MDDLILIFIGILILMLIAMLKMVRTYQLEVGQSCHQTHQDEIAYTPTELGKRMLVYWNKQMNLAESLDDKAACLHQAHKAQRILDELSLVTADRPTNDSQVGEGDTTLQSSSNNIFQFPVK